MQVNINGKVLDLDDAILARNAKWCNVSVKAFIKKAIMAGYERPDAPYLDKKLCGGIIAKQKLKRSPIPTKRVAIKPNAIEQAIEEKLVPKDEPVKKEAPIEIKPPKFSWEDTVAALIENKMNALLVGPAGCGKTYGVIQIAKQLGYEVFRVNFDAAMTSEAFIGATKVKVVDGKSITYFEEGPVVKAMKAEKGLLLLDEIDRITPEHSCALHSLLEDNCKEFILNEDGGRKVKVSPNFRIVATANATHRNSEAVRYNSLPMGKAFLDRFCIIKCEYEEIINILALYSMNLGLIQKIAKVFEVAEKEHVGINMLSIRGSIQFLQCVENGVSENTALQICILNKLDNTASQALFAIWKLF